MKASEVVKGIRAEISVAVPGLSTRSGGAVEILVRPLTELEEEEVLEAAMRDAKAKGVEEPQRGIELYDAAIMVHTVAKAYLDPESPKDARTPFFDGGADQIRTMFGADEIGYLYERQEIHQNDCSPSVRKMTAEELFDVTEAIAKASDDGPFVALAPALRCRWARIMANQLIDSLVPKSPSSSSTAET